MRLTAGLRQDPLGELTALPRPSSWIQGVLLLGGGEVRGKTRGGEKKSKERGSKGKGQKGGEDRRNAPNFVSRFGGIEAPDLD